MNSGKIQVFTVASDGRVADLAVFLDSASNFPDLDVSVIPFDESLEYTKQLCGIYGATLVEPLSHWDDLGRMFYEQVDHVERGIGVKAWRYFRKLNAISYASGDYAFLDANSIIAERFDDLFLLDAGFDVAFGHRSIVGRNFKPWSKYLIGKLNPFIRDGFGAGFWCVRGGGLPESIFVEMMKYPDLRSLVSVAPEQSVLNLALALCRAKVKLVNDILEDRRYVMIGSSRLSLSPDPWSSTRILLEGFPVFAMKWTGNYHAGAFPFVHAEIHGRYVERVLERVGIDTSVGQFLFNKYRSIYAYIGASN